MTNVGEGQSMLQPMRFAILAPPLKSTRDADWRSQIEAYIRAMDENPSAYESDILTFLKLRSDLRGAAGNQTGFSITLYYFRQLEKLTKRVPLNDVPLKISFTWSTCFEHQNSVEQTSIAFEKANVLFNLGAIFAQIAAEKGPSNEASKYLQAAASVFSYIGENFLHPPLADIKRASLATLVSLMLGQAQETAVHQAISTNKSAEMLAKLSAATVSFYSEACKIYEEEASDLRDCGRGRAFFEDLPSRRNYWKALSHYYRAEALYKEDRVGEAMAYLRFALDCAKDLKKGTVSQESMVSFFGERLAKMDRENGLIYHQVVPLVASLPKLEEAPLFAVVTPLSKLSKLAESFNQVDLFSKLLPISMHEEMSRYSEEKSKLLRYESGKVNSADNELQTVLTSLGFPEALEKRLRKPISDEASLPEELSLLRSKAQELNSEAKEKCEAQLRSLEDRIAKVEDRLESDLGANQQWAQNEPGRDLILKKFHLLQQKTTELKGQFLQNSLTVQVLTDISLLRGSAASLLKITPKAAPALQLQVQEDLSQAQELIKKLDHLAKDRQKLFEDLRTKVLADDDLQIDLWRPNDSALPSPFYHQLAKFDEQCHVLEASISEHDATLKAFQSSWTAIIEQEKRERLTASTPQRIFIERLAKSLLVFGEQQRTYAAMLSQVDAHIVEANELEHQARTYIERGAQEKGRFERELQQQSAQRNQEILLQKLSQLKTGEKQSQDLKANNEQKQPAKIESKEQPKPASNQPYKGSVHEPSLLD